MSIERAGHPAEPSTQRATVFISHASKDEAVVRWLAAQVEATGHRAWVAEWDLRPGESLTGKVQGALARCDAFIFLLTEDGYDSVYVAHEVGAAMMSGKPLIVLVDQRLADKPMGMLADVEQVRFDHHDLAAATAAITSGLMHLSERRGVAAALAHTAMPDDSELLTMSVQVNLEFQLSQDQVLVGLVALVAIGGLIYLASREGIA